MGLIESGEQLPGTGMVQVDSQVIEMLGRNRLVGELLRARLEVARPERDRGIDLIAHVDLELGSFSARPIQMKASSRQQFSIERKYEKFPDLIFAFVWNLHDPHTTTTYALTYRECITIADVLGWTTTASWISKGAYTTQQPSARLRALLAPHEMNSQRWWTKITAT